MQQDILQLHGPTAANAAIRCAAALSAVVLLVMTGCSPPAQHAQKPAAPAKVDQPQHEETLNRIQLTPIAEERLRLQTAAVRRMPMHRQRGYGGEVVLPTGASLVVSAPVNGTLQRPSPDGMPAVGARIRSGQTIFSLLPLLSPERDVLTPSERISYAQAQLQLAQAKLDAASQVKQAETQFEAAQIALDRAKELLQQQAGTVMAVDTAQAQYDLAQKALDAANRRVELLEGISLESSGDGQVGALPIVSPQDGLLRAVNAAPGELVPAGTALFEVMNIDRVWIRVPVYAGEASQIAANAAARVKSLADAPDAPGREARPVPAPPTAVPQAAAVDLYYELANDDQSLRPGQRVTVSLSLDSAVERAVIPWSAVVHDIYGGTWVYEQVEPHVFVRRRVSVPYTVGESAVLDVGPPVDAQVVVVGAAELFGAEFEFGK
jgi:cobalt-zinc-cadmium efflux system membrane fusion protein